MAAAQNGTMVFVSGSNSYHVDVYNSDAAAGTLSTFNPNGLAVAGSPTYVRFPFPVTLVDFSWHTGCTQTGIVLTSDGATKNGGTLKYVPHLDTNPMRPKLAINFPAGTLIGAVAL